jgi:hypothetical protein
VLLIRVHAVVVNHFERESLIASIAQLWLCDSSSLDESIFLFSAPCALEASLFHLRHSIRSSNDYTLQSNEFVDVRWIQLSDLVHFFEVIWSHLNDMLILLRIRHVRSLKPIKILNILLNEFLENLNSNQVENWDHIGWIIFELLVQRFVELEDMAAINIKSVLFSLSDLLQKRNVMRFLVHVNIFFNLIV